MALIRDEVEEIITLRCGNFLELLEMKCDCPNPALSDPIAWALRMLGFEPESAIDIVDDDLANVTRKHYDALFDLAELRTLESVAGNLTLVTHTTGPVSENLSDLGKILDKMIPQKRANVASMHGRILAVSLGPTDHKTATFKAL